MKTTQHKSSKISPGDRPRRTQSAGRVIEFQPTAEMAAARRAALNLMEDAVLARDSAEQINSALRDSEWRFRAMIDALPVAVYTTDSEGRLTHYNPLAASLSEQRPELGTERWYVNWKLYRADGTPLPHDEYSMAMAVTERRDVEGEEVIIERADGSRRWLEHYATMLRNSQGRTVGRVHMLVDVTERRQIEETRALLAEIVASSDDAIVSKNLNGVITSWNNGAQKLFGYSAEEIIGKEVTLLIPSDHVSEEREILARIRRGETINHYETVRQRKDGTRLDVSLTVSPVRDVSGRITGGAKIARDITERKRAEAALRNSENRFRTLFDLGPLAVYSCDAKGVIQNFNGRATELWGRVPTVGDTDERFCGSLKMYRPDGTFMPHEWCPMAEVVDGRVAEVRDGEVHIERPDGSRIAVIVNIRPLKNAQGVIEGAINCFYDITERQLGEQQLRESTRKLADSDRRKGEFLAILAHELRNPLATISHGLQIIQLAGADPKIVKSTTELMKRQLDHLVGLVDDLLDINRVSQGKIELRRETVELTAVINDAVAIARPLSDRMQHELTVTLPVEPIRLTADPLRLAQIVGNLLNNACKFTEKGGQIKLSVERQGDEVVIGVRDNGTGIAADQLPLVFNLFMQVDASVERTLSGLGIGLALVKNLVEMHGGTVEAHSLGVGHGSEFVVRLPVLAESQISPPTKPPADDIEIGTACRVLVVDDNRDGAESLAMLLEMSGCETHIAHEGLEAVEMAAQIRPDLILLDIGLPKIDGYEVARRIRAQPWGKDVKLVALTGWGQAEDREKSSAAGFDAHIVKPVQAEALTKLLADVRAARPVG